MNKIHFPVLLNEVIENFAIKKDGIYVDCTLGFAGHSAAILRRINKNGFLIGLDLDSYALNKAKEKLEKEKNNNFSLHHSSYKEFPRILSELGVKKVDGFLFDLGISSHQIDSEHRGFSYMKSSDLDMRFNSNAELTAKKFINTVNDEKLIELIQIYAELGHSKRIAKKIIQMRDHNKMNTTIDLKNAIFQSLDGCSNKIISRVFQAIRIAVNDEINTFKRTLEVIPNYLKKGGRVAIISFHSIEDRVVKRFIQGKDRISSSVNFKTIGGKHLKPSKEEIKENPRSRSAILRVAEKVA